MERELDPSSSPGPIDRRRFLAVVGGATAYVTLRPHLGWARKVAGSGPMPLQPWNLPAEAPRDPVELSRALIGAAVLAPSFWNSQPWRFEVDEGALRVVADTRRSLPALDPGQRCFMLSLGAALENLLVAARAYGLRPTVRYFPYGTAYATVAEVTWTAGEQRRDRALFDAIPLRRTNRREYDRRGIFPQNRVQLLAQVTEEFQAHWIDDHRILRAIGEVAEDAAEARMRDRRAAAEQHAWMRFGDGDARRRGDGVSVDALELGGPARWLAGRYFDPRSWWSRFAAQTAGKRARDAFRSAGAAVLLTARRGGESTSVMGGQAYERFALKATQLGIAQHPIDEPLEQERPRAEILRIFGAAGEEPLLLVRLGHARRPDPTPRRAVAVVASFRSS